MKRLIASAALLALLALLATACAETGAQPLGPAPSGERTSSPSGEPASPSPSKVPKTTFEVWFTYGGSLFVTHRTRPETSSEEAQALDGLFAGPTDEERAAGVGTEIGPDIEWTDLLVDDRVATVTLNDAFMDQETPAIAVARLAQIVYTLTQYDTIDGVLFEVEGMPLTNFGGYGIPRPQRREDFADQLPWILVEAPGIGHRVSSPVTIAGSADVFEAVVSISILDENGNTIASTFTMATCGTGCRGTYSTDVEFPIETTQPGTIHVYEVSAMDGSEINVVDIPVTLTA
jgi:hypothetical protein